MSVAYLTGVLDDGTALDEFLVPPNPSTALELTQGCSTTVRMSVVNPAGVRVPSVGTLLLSIKKRPQDVPAMASVIGAWDTAAGEGVATFALGAGLLDGYEWGRYCYDIKLTDGADRNLVMPTSPLLLRPAVSGNP